jgi:hypothetical protein
LRKFQITNSKLQTNHKFQFQNSLHFGSFELWSLDIVCDLVLGIWDFALPLPLLMLWIRADDVNPAAPFHHAALTANLFD